MQLRKLPVALVVSFPTLRRGEVAWVLLVVSCWLGVAELIGEGVKRSRNGSMLRVSELTSSCDE